MKVKDLVKYGLEDFDIELVEDILLQKGDWPNHCRFSLSVESIGYKDKVILIGKDRRIK